MVTLLPSPAPGGEVAQGEGGGVEGELQRGVAEGEVVAGARAS